VQVSSSSLVLLRFDFPFPFPFPLRVCGYVLLHVTFLPFAVNFSYGVKLTLRQKRSEMAKTLNEKIEHAEVMPFPIELSHSTSRSASEQRSFTCNFPSFCSQFFFLNS
jgi:hypothetical protein